MDFLERVTGYRRFQNWQLSEATKCSVKIDHPKSKIKGKVHLDDRNRNLLYVSFLGVPYARPPLGPLRFEPPQPLLKEKGPRSIKKLGLRKTAKRRAYREPPACIQLVDNHTQGSEDCLYMNIFTPSRPEFTEVLLPVLVYFHGGAYDRGSGNPSTGITPNSLAREKLIVITVNYRLGLFGFLNMRSVNCRGNAGMKDQVMALQWIKNNIQRFKGDPDNVTIIGHSAGGSCVNFHMISPLSKGLFHKAIVMGGGVYCPWGYGGEGAEVKLLFRQALGMQHVVGHVFVEALKERSMDTLLRLSRCTATQKFMLEPKKIMVFLTPSVERYPKGAFLPDTIENLMKKAEPVPTIAGICKQEGYMFFRARPQNNVDIVTVNRQFFHFIKQNFGWSIPMAQKYFWTLKNMYFPNEDAMTEDEIKEHLATMVTDIFFRRFYDNFRIGELMRSKSIPFYVYEFDYFAGRPIIEFPTVKNFSGQTWPAIVSRAAEHGDDMIFLLSPGTLHQCLETIVGEERKVILAEMRKVRFQMISLFTSFCRNGVPRCCPKARLKLRTSSEDLQWKPHTEEDPKYLRIGLSLTLREGRLNEARWARINEIARAAGANQS